MYLIYIPQKKSREESKGTGSGVEILVNEPYEGGPGGNGQYTHKVYHVGSHLPGQLIEHYSNNTIVPFVVCPFSNIPITI